MNPIEIALQDVGPARAGRLVPILTNSLNISRQAARQRLSRARTPVERYPGRLLPKREAFFYLRKQRNTELYWDNLLRDLRETGSIYACAIDAFDARGGIVPVDEFAVVSGAPFALRKQVPAEGVADRLVDLGVMREYEIPGLGPCFVANCSGVNEPLSNNHIMARRRIEGVMLDGLREWARKNGIGSYHSINIRGDGRPLTVGQFKWDLTGPSYFLPVRRVKKKKTQPGFLVADCFAEGLLDVHQIQHFIRKVQTYLKTSNSGFLFPVLMAEGFTGDAITQGHRAGLMLTTPKNLFGQRVADALADLLQTLKNVASIVASSGDKLYELIDRLSEIEGRSGNMRGIMFELMAAHIAQRKFGAFIELGVHHTHSRNGRQAELDVICVIGHHAVQIIECKGKVPGGNVSLTEVEDWLKKIPIARDYVATQENLCERKQTYALWTTGAFEADALNRLKYEQKIRTKRPVTWKDGRAVRRTVADLKLKTIGDALNQHFLKHPMVRWQQHN